MNQPLVVLTYPGHFLLTALTIKSYLKHHKKPSHISVVVDDLSFMAWPEYVQDCKNYYSQFEATVIPVSSNNIINKFAHNGWVRQQVIKLHLDLLVGFESWFFTDGDIVFLNTVDPATVPYSLPPFSEITNQQNIYVTRMLNIKNPGILVDEQQVCVSNPAFRTMSSKILQQLRATVEGNLGNPFDLTQEPLQHIDSIGVSEWELIENFKHHILQEPLNLIQYAPHDYTVPDSSLTFFKHQFITCYCTDSDIGKEWFEKNSITVPEHEWNHIQKISKRTTAT
jgi:hypothetical protein